MEILLVFGGVSEEREVSIRSGARVREWLEARGHTVHLARADTALPCEALLERARASEAVFLCLHGGTGEDGRWQEALERAGVFHYTGSGPAASALAMDKPRAKSCVQAAEVPVAKGAVWRVGECAPVLSFPFVVKPCGGGSSVGFSIIRGQEDLDKLAPSGDLLCETYLPGREYSVAVWEEMALPPVEIRPVGGVYDYAHKYEIGASEEICPAPLSASGLARLQSLALRSFCALGLRDFARVDFKEDAWGRPVFLEANSLPGMTETSLFPLAARVGGISAEILCEKMAQKAAQRKVSGNKA